MTNSNPVRLVHQGWGKELTDALSADSSELLLISPFIKVDALERLLCLNPGKVRVITRFNLADFADGVSDVSALRLLLDARARVRGIRNLHAKLYLFGQSRAVITSANLTKSALDGNHEFGLVTEDAVIIKACRDYFENLWQCGEADITADKVAAWTEAVIDHRLRGGRPSDRSGLTDHGADAGAAGSLPVQAPDAATTDVHQAIVKFQGGSHDRVPLDATTLSVLDETGCHWAVAYSKRRTGVKDNAIMFISRMTRGPNDMRIFGRAVGMKHQPGRDDATAADKGLRPWKEIWPRYIRVHHAEFVAGTMANGVSLNELMDALGSDSFASTKRRAAAGEPDINPRRSYGQQQDVELSEEGLIWLHARLEAAFSEHGKISEAELDQLDWPDPPRAAPEDRG